MKATAEMRTFLGEMVGLVSIPERRPEFVLWRGRLFGRNWQGEYRECANPGSTLLLPKGGVIYFATEADEQ